MKKNSLISLLILVFVVILSSCQKEEQYQIEGSDEPIDNTFYNPEGRTILGKQLENPYSVENMTKALEELKAGNRLKSTSTEEIEIETTHLYVRFLPKNEQELDLLKQDTTLDIYDYPLDHEILTGGVSYHDPSLPDTVITWQYTVVSPDYQFPEIEHETLAELFILEEDEDSVITKSASIDYFDWLKLENKALEITGNLDEESNTTITLKRSKWRPAGTITVYDDVIRGNIPLVGAMVRARRWFTTHKGYTDNKGNFSCDGRFRRDANYSIKWERDDFDIRSGSYGQAYFNGPKKRGDWNLYIQRSGTPKSFLYAHIHRAAMTYYYENWRWGIKTPPQRGFLQQRLHIGGKDKGGRSHYFTFNQIWQSSTIVVYSKDSNGIEFDSRDIFGTTIHELAHASHWEIAYNTVRYGIDYIFDQARLPESWAVGVEWKITNDVYIDEYRNGKIYEDIYQKNTISYISSKDAEGYSPLVIDLIDNDNQRDRANQNNNNYPNDQVKGYTLAQIEDALPGDFGSWWVWRDNIKSKYNNSTEEHVDYLFRTYK